MPPDRRTTLAQIATRTHLNLTSPGQALSARVRAEIEAMRKLRGMLRRVDLATQDWASLGLTLQDARIAKPTTGQDAIDAAVAALSKRVRSSVTSVFNAERIERADHSWSKRWVAWQDHHTRETHKKLNGQTVPIYDTFTVDGMGIRWPGDRAAPPELSMNCRCVLVFVPPPVLTADGGPMDGEEWVEELEDFAVEDDELEELAAAYAFAEPELGDALIAFVTEDEDDESDFGFNPRQWRMPKGSGDLSGRWIDMPTKLFDQIANIVGPGAGSSKLTSAPGEGWEKATPELRDAFKAKFGKSIPPSWQGVYIRLDGDASVVRGLDAAGRVQRWYNPDFEDQQAAEKFARLRNFMVHAPTIEQDTQNLTSGEAAAVRLMYLTGIRVGSSDKQQGKAMAYGATTLQVSHASVDDAGNVKLDFVAKEGIPVSYTIDDPPLVAFIKDRIDKGAPDERLLGTNDSKTQEYLNSIVGKRAKGETRFKNHDLRTLLANRMAEKLVRQWVDEHGAPTTKKAYLELRKFVGQQVADQLRNKPAQALGSYINPAVFNYYDGAAKVAA